MQEIYPNIYTFPIILPNSPLKEVHTYIIKGYDRTVVIDTGYHQAESLDAMLKGLNELAVNMKDVHLVLTHLHADHTGLASIFHEAGATIYAGHIDGVLMNQMATGEYWDLLESFRPLYGISEDEMSITDNPGYRFCLKKPVPFKSLDIGSFFRVGGFKFEILNLIGHTPGHIGLYDRQKQLMISADTVLDPITPNITFWGWDYPNILSTYLTTLDKLKRLPIRLMLPGHRNVITNVNKRIEELEQHHFERLQEILDCILSGERVTVRDVSSRISWRIRANNWNEFPKPQKWFASGETMAHLDYLVHSNHLSMSQEDGILYFEKLLPTVSK
ncbi:TPA: MBL fold metallo-hydrolase [Streptococcus suis]|nr:MBL fold metallo-hydrolase [Streptococcus suis]